MRIIVIVPTLNEVESTRQLIPQLSNLVNSQTSHVIEVLYVDGHSTDGTLDEIRQSQKICPWIHLILENEKRGLGAAYTFGMQHAMQTLRPDYILEFDGDLQHRVADIPGLISQIGQGYDYIIGSRFIPGGSVPKEWGIVRKLLSVGGNWLARSVLGLANIHDVTSGFKLSRVTGFLDQFDFTRLYSPRYAYKIHLLYYMVQQHARVIEVPIVFEARHGGESKLIKNDILETLRVLWLLKMYGA